MSIFGHIFGDERPALPPGARYIVDGTDGSAAWRVKLVLAGQDTGDPDLKKVGPVFTDQAKADQYRDWLEGGPAFDYGTGSV